MANGSPENRRYVVRERCSGVTPSVGNSSGNSAPIGPKVRPIDLTPAAGRQKPESGCQNRAVVKGEQREQDDQRGDDYHAFRRPKASASNPATGTITPKPILPSSTSTTLRYAAGQAQLARGGTKGHRVDRHDVKQRIGCRIMNVPSTVTRTCLVSSVPSGSSPVFSL